MMSKQSVFKHFTARGSLTHLGRTLFSVVALQLMFAAVGVMPAHAIDSSGFFELDGNAIKDTAGSADDWSTFYPSVPAGKRATGIIPDPIPAVFRGSKDTDDIRAWRYDLGSSPPKDDVSHAYAAAYIATKDGDGAKAGDLLIYFGADRQSFTGTASLGFWFFKQQVLRSDATHGFVNAQGLPASHSEGDALVAFEYTNGGAVTSVKLYKWTGSRLVQDSVIGLAPTQTPGVFCNSADTLCGATNSANITLATGATVAAGQFFEGAINISQIVGGDSCFASFMATSRTSDTINATIKNFLLGDFPVCHLTVTKACDSAVYQSDNTVLNKVKGAIVNDGSGSLSNITLVDNPAFNAGTLQYFNCSNGLPTGSAITLPNPLTAGASVCYTGQYTSTALKTRDDVTATANTGSSTISATANASCEAAPPSSSLKVTKVCDLDLVALSGGLGVKVNFSGSVENTGSVGLTNVTICEKHEGSTGCLWQRNLGNLTPSGTPGSTVSYSGYYLPTMARTGSDISTETQPEFAVFKDQATATGTLPAILGGTITSPGAEATCTLCSNTAP